MTSSISLRDELTARYASVDFPAEYSRPPAMVQDLMRLGGILLPGARLDVCERLAVLYIYAVADKLGFTMRDVERYKQDAIRGGYVSKSAA